MVNPTGYTALDLIGFTDKGDYSSATNYVRNDLAHYAGSIWRCLIDDTSNVTPAENANWTVFVSEPSNQVEASIAPIEVSPAQAAHAQGTQLYYNGTLYKAKTAIAIGDSLVVNTNIEVAPKITEQLADKANTSDLGTAAAKDSTNAVTQNDTDLVESGAVYTVAQGIKVSLAKVEADIAPVEDGDTASQAYAIGEQFIKGDELFKAKTAIAQGDTLTLNTNYEAADNVTDQINSVKTALANEATARQTADNNISEVISENGAKNLLPLSASTVVSYGVTRIASEDGVRIYGTVDTSSIGGVTAVLEISRVTLKAGRYKLSGTPSGGNVNVYLVLARAGESNLYDTGSGVIFENESEMECIVYWAAVNGAVIDTTLKPMITLASQPNSDYAHYVPYAKTNKTLTDEISTSSGYDANFITNVGSKIKSNSINLQLGIYGKVVVMSMYAVANEAMVNTDEIFTLGNLPSNAKVNAYNADIKMMNGTKVLLANKSYAANAAITGQLIIVLA